jgi:hypothetical protein
MDRLEQSHWLASRPKEENREDFIDGLKLFMIDGVP